MYETTRRVGRGSENSQDTNLRKSTRRQALRHFLTSRRTRLSPADVGIAPGGRRHTAGLRREEVAVLAGVSASWYTWLEQGRDIKVSDGILEAISSALNLNGIERYHLFMLAGLNPPAASLRATLEEIARITHIVDGYHPLPAFAVDRYWNNLAINEAFSQLLGLDDKRGNHLIEFFTSRSIRERYVNWDEIAVRLVGQFQVQSARFPNDANYERMVRSLSAASQEFAELWTQHLVQDSTMDNVQVKSSSGTTHFERITLGLLERYDLRLVLHVPTGAAAGNPS